MSLKPTRPLPAHEGAEKQIKRLELDYLSDNE